MKILMIILVLLMTGCANTSLTYKADGSVEWGSSTLWKDVEGVEVEWGDKKVKLGSSVGNGGESIMMNNVISCYLSPALCDGQ
jgi:hypothetical protein